MTRIEYSTNCPACNGKMISGGTLATLVGYCSPPGHNHDDNCVTRSYKCLGCGEAWYMSKQNKCPTNGCDWVGKKICFCHKGEKVDEWPEPFTKGEKTK